MNERIKELAREAGLLAYNPEGPPTKLEKFAELIVAEATKALWTEECMTSDLALAEYSRNSNRIRDYFGL